MPNILLINGHPKLETSHANLGVVLQLQMTRSDVTVRTLADEAMIVDCRQAFDVPAEQAALRDADVIVLQFPFFWYSFPGLMKQWIDDVFTHGFAHGTTGTALRGKPIIFSFTTGAPAEDYSVEGAYGVTIDAFIQPMRQLAKLCGMKPEFVVSYGMHFIPGVMPSDAIYTVYGRAMDHAARLSAKIDEVLAG